MISPTTRTGSNSATRKLSPRWSGHFRSRRCKASRWRCAELLGRLGRTDEALATLVRAEAVRPLPPESERVEIRSTILASRGDFPGALKIVDASALAPAEKTLLRARLRISEFLAAKDNKARATAETAMFHELQALRNSPRPETTATLAALAKAIREPSKDSEPIAWDLLADGAAALGALPRAGELARLAASRANALGHHEEAANYRLRAGAFLFQGESFAEADDVLTRLVEDPAAGPNRPRAALLRSLTRGRALAKQAPGSSASAYASALKYQIDKFPNDSTASEARWLLGKLRLAESDRAGAMAYWEAIPHGNPRWAESRAEIAALRQRDLDLQRLNNDKIEVAKRLAEARKFLASSLAQAKGDVEANDLLLASARLELTPGIGDPEEARKICERVERSVVRPDQRDAARRLHLVALAALNRWFDAEHAARQGDPPFRSGGTFADGAVVGSMGLGVGIRPAYPSDRLFPPHLIDARGGTAGRSTRGAARSCGSVTCVPCCSAETMLARAALRGFVTTEMLADDLLRDLAETFSRLEGYDMAVKVQQLRGRNLTTGSLPWFDARYGLALALYRAGKPKESLQLIEATAILHPDLGGGDLHDKFVRLRQRLNPTE